MYRHFVCVEFEDIPQDEGEQQSNEDMLKNFKKYLTECLDRIETRISVSQT